MNLRVWLAGFLIGVDRTQRLAKVTRSYSLDLVRVTDFSPQNRLDLSLERPTVAKVTARELIFRGKKLSKKI